VEGALFFAEKAYLFLVVAFKTYARTTKLTTLNVQISQFPQKIDFSSAWGCTLCLGVHLQLFPVNLAPKIFSPPWGVHLHPVHPLTTPMYAELAVSSLAVAVAVDCQMLIRMNNVMS